MHHKACFCKYDLELASSLKRRSHVDYTCAEAWQHAHCVGTRGVRCAIQVLYTPFVVNRPQACVLHVEVEQASLEHDCWLEVDRASITLNFGVVNDNRHLQGSCM